MFWLGLEITFPVTAPYTDTKIAVSHTRQQDKVVRKNNVRWFKMF